MQSPQQHQSGQQDQQHSQQSAGLAQQVSPVGGQMIRLPVISSSPGAPGGSVQSVVASGQSVAGLGGVPQMTVNAATQQQQQIIALPGASS